MVRVVDEGSHFEASIDKVWKLVEAHQEHLSEIHPEILNPKPEGGGEHFGVFSFDNDMEGRKVRVKMRVTAVPPLAQVIEMLEGPLAGSKIVNYYTPRGNRTGVTVVGDFMSPVLPPSQLEAVAHDFLDRGFAQDSAYLRKMR